ncbi:uncharacterized protein [Miscanthus floridulus]|uniref:uncharacterized protein n=1 Tax=Miscanthus floridulus TaxID=154761 RepID=UPI003457CC85
MAEAGAPKTTKAVVMAARLSVQEAEMEAAEASVAPLVQGPLLLRESARETEVEAVTTQTQLAPLVAWVKELEEELTCAVSDRDASRGRAAEATASAASLAGQLGAEQRALQLTKGALYEALAAAKASQTEAVVWRGMVEESEAEVTRAAEASSAVQMVLDNEIGEHEALKRAALSACEALEVEGVQCASGSEERCTWVSSALAVISSHYVGVDLPAVSDGYVLPDDDEEADAVVIKLMEAAKGPGAALATLFEEEVVPPLPSAGAKGPEP